MKNIYLIAFAIFGLFLAGCKDKDKDPKPAVGSMRALVTPAGSVSAMRVTTGGTVYETGPDANNNFVIGNLPPGQYTVSFRTNVNFTEPAKRLAEVTASNETNLGTIQVEKLLETGSFSASANGNSWNSPLPFGSFADGRLVITATVVDLSGSSEIITLMLPSFTGPGVYSGPTQAVATFTAAAVSGSMKNWSSNTGQCSINITSFNSNQKLVSGSFNFAANPADMNTTGTQTVTNGTFTNVRFQ